MNFILVKFKCFSKVFVISKTTNSSSLPLDCQTVIMFDHLEVEGVEAE